MKNEEVTLCMENKLAISDKIGMWMKVLSGIAALGNAWVDLVNTVKEQSNGGNAEINVCEEEKIPEGKKHKGILSYVI